MKPIPGYAYIENNRVVVNEEMRPDEKDFPADGCKHVKPRYIIALSAWNDSCIKVKNVKKGVLYDKDYFIRIDNGRYETSYLLINGQPVFFTKGEKAKITEIR